jgi:hypothetical protein
LDSYQDAFEDQFSGGQAFDIVDIVKTNKFASGHIIELASKELTLDFVRQTGLRKPLRFRERKSLGMKLPEPSFTVADVKKYVGADRVVDVMDCSTQEALVMKMEDWVRYYEDPEKSRLLNVISLEFSKSKLDRMVASPAIVRAIDWITNAWPKELKAKQTSQGNSMKHMKYPKVQKYCLMSVGGCYTDFHIDFGGSSVWYHVLRGVKIFFLVPPSPTNIRAFEKWSKAGGHQEFYGDMVKDCKMVTLEAGHTFMIPTGWIHAVFTPVDSLVFGGNFLHGHNIDGQLSITKLESRLGVPERYRFPFFQQLHWYAADEFRRRLDGRCNKGASREEGEDGSRKLRLALTKHEVKGLADLLPQLQAWAASSYFSKNIPDTLIDGEELANSVSDLMDNPDSINPIEDSEPENSDEYESGDDDSAAFSNQGSGKRRRLSQPETTTPKKEEAALSTLQAIARAVHAYKVEHKRDPPSGHFFELPNGVKVDGGRWFAAVKAKYTSGSMPKAHATVLQAIFQSEWGAPGGTDEKKPDEKKAEAFTTLKSIIAAVQAHKLKHGVDPPLGHLVELSNGTMLDGGSWCTATRTKYTAGLLSQQQLALLEDVSQDWPHPATTVATGGGETLKNLAITIDAVLKYKRMHEGAEPADGDMLELSNGEKIDGGRWCTSVKYKYKNGKLPKTQIGMLSEVARKWGEAMNRPQRAARGFAVNGKSNPGIKSETAPSDDNDPSKPLPHPWKAFTQPSTNMIYYANPDTRESVWTRKEVFDWERARLAAMMKATNSSLSLDDLDVIFADDVQASAAADSGGGGSVGVDGSGGASASASCGGSGNVEKSSPIPAASIPNAEIVSPATTMASEAAGLLTGVQSGKTQGGGGAAAAVSPNAEKKVSVTATDPEMIAKYTQLSKVRQGLERYYPLLDAKGITNAAKRKWVILPEQVRAAFCNTFHAEMSIEEAEADTTRQSKYARKSYRAPENMMKRTQSEQGHVLAALNVGVHESVGGGAGSSGGAGDALAAALGGGGAGAALATALGMKASREEVYGFGVSEREKAVMAAARLTLTAEIPSQAILGALTVAPAPAQHATIQQQCDWLLLPASVWHVIFRHLSASQIVRCMQSCSKLEEYSTSSTLWPSITLSDAALSTACVRRVNKLMPRSVNVQWSGINDDQMQALIAGSTQLGSLNLCGCRALKKPLLHLATPQFHLTCLNLNFAPFVNDSTLMYLHVHRASLVELHIAETTISSAGLLKMITVLGSLQVLDIYNCAAVADDAFATAAITCPNLRMLDVRGTMVTDALLPLLSLCRKLEQVDFRGCAGCRLGLVTLPKAVLKAGSSPRQLHPASGAALDGLGRATDGATLAETGLPDGD